MVRAVARYTNRPREVRWKTAGGIFLYVFAKSDFGIMFQEGSRLEVVAFADADYANKATYRRPVYGGAIMCAGAYVCWCVCMLVFSDAERRYALNH